MNDFEEKIGYKFKNRKYLETALTHSSYANEHKIRNNERLEFLGDSVLSIIVSEYLFYFYSNKSEGKLSKVRASLVCENALFELSKKIDLANYIRLGKGEELTGGRNRPSIISDAFEALLAAIFIDSDFDTAKKWLLSIMEKELKSAGTKFFVDYKSRLQEYTQKGCQGKVTYKLLSESGPDHEKHFVCSVFIDDKERAKGSGPSKKEAEQDAARKALKTL